MFNPLLSHHVMTVLHEDRMRELGRWAAPRLDEAVALRQPDERSGMATIWRRLSIRPLTPTRQRG